MYSKDRNLLHRLETLHILIIPRTLKVTDRHMQKKDGDYIIYDTTRIRPFRVRPVTTLYGYYGDLRSLSISLCISLSISLSVSLSTAGCGWIRHNIVRPDHSHVACSLALACATADCSLTVSVAFTQCYAVSFGFSRYFDDSRCKTMTSLARHNKSCWENV
jgi:hypothetical protein